MAARTPTYAGIEAQLSNIPVLTGCSKKQLRHIARTAKPVSFEAGDVICREGDVGLGLHVVVNGEVKVIVRGRTRRRLGPGSFFGEIALLDGGPRTATVVAETPVETLTIPSWTFRGLLKQDPGLALPILEEVCRRLRAVEASITC